MARIRTIKPEFFTSEDIVQLEPLARLLYVALWCEADREGRLAWKPGTFKLRYFPGDNCDIETLCASLVRVGLVALYGDGLAYIPRFANHQHINPRESASQIESPPTPKSRVTTRHSRVSDVQGGRERKGKIKRVDDASGFDAFWTAYPNGKAKQAAAKAWAKISPDEQLQAMILVAVEAQKQSADWRRDGGQYVPHAATWLNGERWNDVPAKVNGSVVDMFAGAR